MIYKAILFDLDGTLLDTLGDLTYALNLVLQKRGYKTRTREEVKSFVGDGAAMLMKRAMPHGTGENELEEATSEDKRLYLENMLRECTPYEGICELLENLRAKGMKIGVVSNKYYESAEKLCSHFFKELDVVVGENEAAGLKPKPSPDMINLALMQLGVSPSECVFVGDSDVDVICADNAGLKCISVTWGFRSREFLSARGAYCFADKASDILDILNDDDLNKSFEKRGQVQG